MLSMLLLAAAVAAAEPSLSPASQTLVTAVQASIEEARARQAALPPPKNDAERIQRLGELDRAPRLVITSYDMSKIPPAERDAAMARVSQIVDDLDRQDQAALLSLLPPEGWFLRSKYGDKAATAAFLIVQHGDVRLQKRFLPMLERLAKAGEVDGQDYGMMFDRVATSEGRPQRYGTQFRCDGGKWRPYPMEDADHVDERRAALGFLDTFRQEEAYLTKMPTCPQTRSPPPKGMKLD